MEFFYRTRQILLFSTETGTLLGVPGILRSLDLGLGSLTVKWWEGGSLFSHCENIVETGQ